MEEQTFVLAHQRAVFALGVMQLNIPPGDPVKKIQEEAEKVILDFLKMPVPGDQTVKAVKEEM